MAKYVTRTISTTHVKAYKATMSAGAVNTEYVGEFDMPGIPSDDAVTREARKRYGRSDAYVFDKKTTERLMGITMECFMANAVEMKTPETAETPAE